MASENEDTVLIRGSAYWLFALIVVAAPLLFGATDRFFQALLLGAFALGLFLAPPLLWREGSRVWVAGLAVLGFLLVKEFAPAVLFGQVGWRTTLVQSFEVRLPWTHHPEPVRAMEALISTMVGVLWFLWVRTLARRHEGAARVLWILLASGAAVGAVSLYFGTSETSLIYGIREVPGYKGFGPFPNRNHTACFLAMTVVIGVGILFQSLSRKKIVRAVVALFFLLLAMVALLETRSRGGLVALVGGLGVFGLALLVRSPNRKMLAGVFSALLIGLTVFFVFGRPLWERMADMEGVSRDLRWTVWQDARTMWLDAPLFGHGIASFTSIFPMYQSIVGGNTIVLHPESSWLQWLNEMGLVLTLGVAGAGIFWLGRTLLRLNSGVAGGTLRAAATGAVAVLLLHSVYDVPAHRWATAACALAALAVACPARDARVRLSPGWALLPVAVGALWLVPLVKMRPLWSTASLARVLASNFSSTQVSTETLDRLARYFPLNPDLQHSLGVRSLIAGGPRSETWRRFRIADRLKPSSYLLPTAQAVVAAPVSRDMALYFWSVAIERAEHRAEEFFLMAWERTESMPGAREFWRQYVQANPRLLLSYARAAQPGDVRPLLQEWMQRRTESLQPFELIDFYTFLPSWGTAEELETWMKAHPERQGPDVRIWAQMLSNFGRGERAWDLLSPVHPEPAIAQAESSPNAAALEVEWRVDPDNFLKALRLVGALQREGNEAMRDQVILTMAAKDEAPNWFLERAAHLYAQQGQYDEAVAALLRVSAR